MILEKIAAATQKRVEEQKKEVSLEQMKQAAEGMEKNTGFPLEQALRQEGIAFLCEVKKASPSKGLIAENFDYLAIAKEYEAAGAAAISVLTEPEFFLGSKDYLKEISAAVSIPTLRKDFVVDEYMIYEAKVLGASGVLLICALLEEERLKRYLDLAHHLGLSALVEAHDEAEVAKALAVGARLIGVNNRDLRTFTVDMENSLRLRKRVPEDVTFVSESGIRTAEDVARLKEAGVNAVLIGETLMRSEDKAKALSQLRGECL